MQIPHSYLPDNYLPLLDELNRIVRESRAPLEGNLFYFHHEPNPSRETIAELFAVKRGNFAAACRVSHRMLEIGLNGGHSALLALAHGVELHSVDICMHPYTHPVADFLKKEFKDRFHFYAGDSQEILPQLLVHDLRFDLLHIDGDHRHTVCQIDTENARRLALQNAWVLVDDTDMQGIREFYDQQIQAEIIIPARPGGWIDTPHHEIGKLRISL